MDLVREAMGSLLPNLHKLLGYEYKLQTGMKQQLKFITRELEIIDAFLHKVSDVPWYQLDAQTKAWAREAREVSYEMEDVLDTFLVHFQDREPANPSRLRRAMKNMASLFSKGKARRHITSAIQDIKNRLQNLADQRARYRVDDIMVNHPATTLTVDPRLQAMYKEVANLVGIDKPRDYIISKLSLYGDDMACSRKIVSISGTGGIGKTTLAKAVYDNLRAYFPRGAFVPVGRNPNMAKLLMDILYDLDNINYADVHSFKNRDERQLIDSLREILKDKRYFIVMDDLWDTRSWDETIKLALLENNRGSRIIITTRNSQVATKIGDEVYKMQPLSKDNSKKLFYTRVFGAKYKWPDNKPDEISNKILKKCDGVPLAIITMASLLVGKPREKWSDVFTSVGFGHKDETEVDNTMKILSFSYYDMPAHLRTCLLYLNVFPEDYTIDKGCLIWRWIAESIIQGKPGIQLFELGEQYFNDLVNRSMVQAIDMESEGRVQGCRVHDMVLDLIRSISSEENFVTILDNDEVTVLPRPSSARRLALHNNTMNHTTHGIMVDMPQLRSFVSIRCAFGNSVPLSGYRFLRVLEMENCKTVRPFHLVHLGNLLHLRYLGLQGTKIDDLPNEIGALKLLQSLNLSKTKIKELTPSISRLTQLVCLKCNSKKTLAPGWIGKLTSLEELQIMIHIDLLDSGQVRGFLKALGSLRELRVFESDMRKIGCLNMERDLVLSLRNLHKLQHLKLSKYTLENLVYADTALWSEAGFVLPRHLRFLFLYGFIFSRLPSCISDACLPNLTHLSLHVDSMDQKGLEFLGRLPELCYFSLLTKSTVTISNIIGSNNGYFQKLRICHIPFSMIQFQCNKENSNLSLHIWDGTDAMPFGSSKKDCSLAPYAMMPNVEVLESQIYVRALKDGNGDCSNTGLQYLPSLQIFNVHLNCEGVTDAEVDETVAALRKTTEAHPNHPTLRLDRWGLHKMICPG